MAAYEVIVNDDGSIVVNEVSDIDVVSVVEETTVVVSPDDAEVATVEQTTTVVEAPDGSVTVSDVGIQGPAAEENVPFATRVDFVGDTLIYKAQAQPGTLDASNAWRIQEITFVGADEDVEIRWASGTSDFDKVWDDRATYLYS